MSDESKAVQEAVAAGMDPTIAKEMEEAGELTSTEAAPAATEEQPEHIEKKPEGDEAPAADDESAAAAAGTERSEGEEGDGPNREERFMPAWKAKELAKKAAEDATAAATSEYERKLAELSGQQGGASTEDLTAFAEEFNLAPEAAAAMVDRMSTLLEGRLGIGDLKKDLETRKVREQEQAEITGFENEYSEKDTQKALEAAAQASGATVTPELKEKVKTLAYSTTYAKYRLPDIIRLEASKLFTAAPAPAASAEAGRGGAGRAAVTKSIDQMTADEVNALSDDEFLKLSDDLGKSGSRLPISKGKK